MSQKRRNPVAKHQRQVCRSQTFANRKANAKRGYCKHRGRWVGGYGDTAMRLWI